MAAASGVYGTQGAGSANNVPGARTGATSWTDSSGNLWLFGGEGYGATGAPNAAYYLNDLWEFRSSAGTWTWVAGSNVNVTNANASAVYGTQGIASTTNVPGGRGGASSWTDSAGNLWLFGGDGEDSTGTTNIRLNDLWKFSPTTGTWTWVGGSNVGNAVGTYGTQGSAASGNAPGARYSGISWTDSAGNLWLFGGYGFDSTGGVGRLNDLWKYNPTAATWTWVGGSYVRNGSGVYGTKGTAASGNVPSARSFAAASVDSAGNLWVFGGYGYDSTGVEGYLDDLWRYNPTAGSWVWVGGSNLASNTGEATGVYGTQGVASASNLPPARFSANSWTDSSGNFWLFGGAGFTSSCCYLNDLWEYSPTSGTWTWIGGAAVEGASGIYGTQGIAAPGDAPGARYAANSWTDSTGNFWMFGGTDPSNILLNDLWKYTP